MFTIASVLLTSLLLAFGSLSLLEAQGTCLDSCIYDDRVTAMGSTFFLLTLALASLPVTISRLATAVSSFRKRKKLPEE